MSQVGDHPLTGVGNLANVTVAHPGEHWSDRVAAEDIEPGVAIVPDAGTSGRGKFKVATSGDTATQLAIALRPVDHPDVNTGPNAMGPNEIRNQKIKTGEYVHAYYSGAFHLTLVTPDNYAVGDLVGWDANGSRPTGKTGTGAWAKNASADIKSVFEVLLWRPVNNSNEGVLTVRFVGRTQN